MEQRIKQHIYIKEKIFIINVYDIEIIRQNPDKFLVLFLYSGCCDLLYNENINNQH